MQQLLDIIKEHNELNRYLGIQRQKYLSRIRVLLDCPEIIAVVGLRRCGKSTILQQLQHYLVSERKVAAQNVIYINLEDPRLDTVSDGKNSAGFNSEHCEASFAFSSHIHFFG